MKKVVLVGIVAMMMAGCAEMAAQRQAETQKSYDDIASCRMPDTQEDNGDVDKASFIDSLTSQASSSSADNFIMKTKLDRLQLVGWNQSVSTSIVECSSKQRSARVYVMKSQFDRLKAATKNAEEKKALISAYSAWETYVTSPTDPAKQDFETKLAYYKNM